MPRTKVATLVMLLALAGCSDPPPKRPEATPAASASSSADAAGQAVATRTVDAAGDILTMTMLPLARDPSGTVVMTIQARLDRPATKGRSSNITTHFAAATTGSADNIRLVDTEQRRVYLPAAGTDGRRCVCTGRLRLGEGDTGAIQASFSGIPAGTTRLSVMLPYAGVFADVPVNAATTGENPTTAAEDGATTGGNPATANESAATTGGSPTTAQDDVGPSHAADLEGYTERLDVPLRSRITKDGVEFDLGTDILFDLDSATLTPAAAEVIDAATASLEKLEPGPLTITGHTDSTASEQHNQDLSQRRAQAVARALRLPAAQWPQTVTGKGESQPAFPNDTADHRRLNRRVTISIRVADGGAAKNNTGNANQVPLPRTKGKQATGKDGVEVALPLGRGTVRFTAERATRLGPYVQVDLAATNVGSDDATILDYLGQGVFTIRDELDPYAPYGANGVRMLAGDTAAYNLDYRNEQQRHRCLCDRLLNQAFPPAGTRTISLWFPAPADGITYLALDVPDRFRLKEIPIG